MKLFYGSLNDWLLKSVMEFSALRVSKYWFCLNLSGFSFCHGQEQSRHTPVRLPTLLTSIKSNSSFVGNKFLHVTFPFLSACPASPLKLHHSYLQSSLVKDKKSETPTLSYTLTLLHMHMQCWMPFHPCTLFSYLLNKRGMNFLRDFYEAYVMQYVMLWEKILFLEHISPCLLFLQTCLGAVLYCVRLGASRENYKLAIIFFECDIPISNVFIPKWVSPLQQGCPSHTAYAIVSLSFPQHTDKLSP